MRKQFALPNATTKQAWKIYYEVFNSDDTESKSHELMRENLEDDGWDGLSGHMVERLMNLTGRQASYVIDLLSKKKYKEVEEIIKNV